MKKPTSRVTKKKRARDKRKNTIFFNRLVKKRRKKARFDAINRKKNQIKARLKRR